jgi:para-aminobenzoate synthetase component 1
LAHSFLPSSNRTASPSSSGGQLPLVIPFDQVPDLPASFAALKSLPGRLWLDSATAVGTREGGEAARTESSSGPVDRVAGLDTTAGQLARFSFLTADPLASLVAFPQDPDPWPALARLAACLPPTSAPQLPPFQGGLAGLLGYEASRWLEPQALRSCHLHQHDDFPTPAIWFGVFDWTIAVDHAEGRAWLVCQGWRPEPFQEAIGGGVGDTRRRASRDDRASGARVSGDIQLARRRADQILGCLSESSTSGPAAPGGGAGPSVGRPRRQRIDRVAGSGSPTSLDLAQQAGVRSNFTGAGFRTAVAEIVRRIRRGDSFQVNLAQRLLASAPLDADELYLRLRQSNPAPFAGYLDGGSFQVLSSSPEGFLQVRQRRVSTRPIKGTVPRTGDPEIDRQLAQQLSASEKDRAENIMIVDLMRNDLSRVCDDDSVVVRQLCQIERYQYVQHLVSVVEGRLRGGMGVPDLLAACFPGGSVTGAPKIEAMKTIAQLEPNPRGPYCGSLGYLSCTGDADFNILIRTVTGTGCHYQIPVGGGITARSDPAAEEAETWAKAEGMLRAFGSPAAAAEPAVSTRSRPGSRDPRASDLWRPA